MSAPVEDPTFELEIRFDSVTDEDGPALEVSWLFDPGSHGRGVARLRFVEGWARARLDVVLYDPALEPPFEIVAGDAFGNPPKIAAVGVTPGRKAVAMISVAPWARHLGPGAVLPVPAAPPMARPADGHELELVACLIDRLEGGSFLDDLAEAGLRISLDVRRLSTPIGSLEVARGRALWTEEGS